MSKPTQGKTLCEVFESDALRRELDKPDNPPAFPLFRYYNNGQADQLTTGMTLRDYFAAAALRCVFEPSKEPVQFSLNPEWCAAVARDCYTVADAMLKERAKP